MSTSQDAWLASGFPITVYLRDVETGVARAYADTGYPGFDGEAFLDFLWSDGNYACDCNRVLFLYGHDSPEAEARGKAEYNCTTRRIVIDRIVRDSDGLVLYTETEPPA